MSSQFTSVEYRRPVVGAILALTIVCLGCSQEVPIRQYRVAKQDVAPRKTPDDQVPGEVRQMLGAIVPHGQSAWYFKLTDAPEKVVKLEGDFRAMVNSVSFDQDGMPNFELADGWSRQDVRQIVYARLTHDADGVTATLTQLPAPTTEIDDWEASVRENVNRWRGQLSLSPQDWEGMQTQIEQLPALAQGPAKAYFVDLIGNQSSQGMGSAPFMNSAASNRRAEPPARESTPPAEENAAAKIASSGETPATSTAPREKPISYEVPEGWVEEQAGGIRLAMFAIEQADEAATVSVSTASGEVDVLLDMWFDQLELDKSLPTKQAVLDSSETVDVNGVEGTVFLIPGDAEKSILVARIPWTERESLFVKLTGTTQLVTSQRPALIEFLKSMKW